VDVVGGGSVEVDVVDGGSVEVDVVDGGSVEVDVVEGGRVAVYVGSIDVDVVDRGSLEADARAGVDKVVLVDLSISTIHSGTLVVNVEEVWVADVLELETVDVDVIVDDVVERVVVVVVVGIISTEKLKNRTVSAQVDASSESQGPDPVEPRPSIQSKSSPRPQ